MPAFAVLTLPGLLRHQQLSWLSIAIHYVYTLTHTALGSSRMQILSFLIALNLMLLVLTTYSYCFTYRIVQSLTRNNKAMLAVAASAHDSQCLLIKPAIGVARYAQTETRDFSVEGIAGKISINGAARQSRNLVSALQHGQDQSTD